MTGDNGESDLEIVIGSGQPEHCPRVEELQARIDEAVRILRLYGATGAKAALAVLEGDS